MSLVALAGCAGPADTDSTGLDESAIVTESDELNGSRESNNNQPADTANATEEVGESSSRTEQSQSNATLPRTDNDQSNSEEDNASESDSAQREVRVVEGSPRAGWANETLQTDALDAVGFLAKFPQNRTKRNRTVTDAATAVCNGHDRVVANTASNSTKAGQEFYRGTYRVAHAADTMHDLGANINVDTIDHRMQMARDYSGKAAKYAPVVGSYQRLHNASCAVKRDEPGSMEDFYIASAEFTVNLVFAEQGVIYKASFRTTGMASRAVGLNRLARVCGYKCVGLVQSEVHWLVRGTYSGALSTVSAEAMDGNLTVDEWNESVRQEVGGYVGNKTNATLVGTGLVSEDKVMDCVSENLDAGGLWKFAGKFPKETISTLDTILTEQKLPNDVDLSFLTEIESVSTCLDD